ncbi:hypothetical protein [Botrimarina mediterranea]|uniref:hypothetical protein n=1 Tax=Botrimarina mediterranea TaxID=2528022 RepID=UPI00118B4C96|nr:hypothetical protein K2D_34800 [Planctomycetes bacterium K2D]
MADVIREVLIRGRMEIMKADLAVPDISAFTKTMEAQNKLTQEIIGRVNELSNRYEQAAAEREREAKAERQREQERREAVAAAKKAKEEERQRAKEAAEATRKAAEEAEKLAAAQRKRAEEEAKIWEEVAEANAKAEKEKQDAINATNRARDEAIRREKSINDSLLKGGDSLKTMGDGAFTLARGLTLLGLEGSENLEAVARGVANVQGKFDLFRGGVDVIKGGVETARAFGEAFEEAGGPIDLVKGRLAGLAAFMGPTGLVAAGAVAAGAVIVGVFEAMREDIETETERAERRLRDFVNRANSQAARASAAFTRADAIRDTLAGDQRIGAIQSDLANLGERRGFNVAGEQRERELARERIAQLDAYKRNLAGGAGPGAAPSQSMLDQVAAAEREQNQLRMRLEITAPEKRKEEIKLEQEREAERQKLYRELRSETQQREQSADLLRGSGIDDANSQIAERERERERVQEQLRRTEEQRAIQERKQAAERAGLTAAERAYVDRIGGNLEGRSVSELERLRKIAPENFGAQITDELVRQGGGTPAARTDEAAELRAELAQLTAAIKESRGKRDALVSEDAKLDDQARQSVESINELLRTVAKNTELLQQAQNQLKAELQQAQ